MIGTTLLHYAIDARLGEGGMGTVYRARDTVLNRTVALKVLASGADAESTKRLLHEARAASALNHPNSVTIHAVEQQGDLAFIVMEHVAGVPLDRAIPGGGFPLERALRYAGEIAGAVAAAHAQGIVHRDLKPANVMLTADDRVKVLDFGIARRTALKADEATRLQTMDGTLAAEGTLIGTPGYMAPEQIEGKPADQRSDVFALGVLIYELLTGVAPFRRDTTWGSLDATVHQAPAPLATVPTALASLVTRCLAKDPASRPASAAELFEALAAIRREHFGAPGAGRVYRWVAVAALVIAVAVVAAVFAWSRARERRLHWVRDTAIPEIGRLFAAGDPIAAYRLALTARATLPDDPQVRATWEGFTNTISLASQPPGADVAVRALSGKDEGWIALGKTPGTADVPVSQFRWRFTLEGHDPLEIVPNPFPMEMSLVRSGAGPPGMVRVPAGSFEQESTVSDVKLPEYLDRHLRGDEPPVQGVRRSWRVSESRLLEGADRGEWPHVELGGSRKEFPRRDRTSRSGDVGAGDLPRRAGRLAGRRRQLVRGRRLRRVRGQVAADDLSLVARVGRVRHLFRGAELQQFPRPRDPARRRERQPRPIRHPRPRRQRQGMDLERGRQGAALHPRRRVERAAVRVPRRGRPRSAVARADLRIPLHQGERADRRGADRRGHDARARSVGAEAGQRRGVRVVSPALRLRQQAPRRDRGREGRGESPLPRRARLVRGGVWRPAGAADAVPAPQRQAAVPGARCTFPDRMPCARRTAAPRTCSWSTSSPAAAAPWRFPSTSRCSSAVVRRAG